jgi:hypothetical protein
MIFRRLSLVSFRLPLEVMQNHNSTAALAATLTKENPQEANLKLKFSPLCLFQKKEKK